MYRAVTFYFLAENVDLSSNSQVIESLDSIKLHIDFSSENEMKIFLDEDDISLKIRSQEVTSAVSIVSAIKEVREMMVQIQRSFTEIGNFVVEGRDIGTVVFPDAEHKFYLQADYDIRAKRRLADFEKINEAKNINEIKEDLEKRDKYDSTRKLSPLKIPDGAIIVASYGTFSTGINIRTLHNIVFASPSKSRIRNLQSIGRDLRLKDNDSNATLYDISDDLTHNEKENYTLSHFRDCLLYTSPSPRD